MSKVNCTSTGASADFDIQCKYGQEAIPGYRQEDRFPGAPKNYKFYDRTKPAEADLYLLPNRESVELICRETTVRTYCDPRHKTQCPCNCDCMDAAEYNHKLNGNKTLGEAFYCEPVPGFMKIEPLDFGLDPNKFYDMSQKLAQFRGDSHICVDSTPPKLELLPAKEYRIQGDPKYEHTSPKLNDNNKQDNMKRAIKRFQV